jgi:hypothetical protein
MTVLIKFVQSGSFHDGEFKSLDLEKISDLRISRLRNTAELLATTPENPQPHTPYIIARREREYEIQQILNDIQRLKKMNRDCIFEITDTEARLVNK